MQLEASNAERQWVGWARCRKFDNQELERLEFANSAENSRKKYEGIIVQVRRCSGLFVCRMSPDCKGHNCHPEIIVGFQ